MNVHRVAIQWAPVTIDETGQVIMQYKWNVFDNDESEVWTTLQRASAAGAAGAAVLEAREIDPSEALTDGQDMNNMDKQSRRTSIYAANCIL